MGRNRYLASALPRFEAECSIIRPNPAQIANQSLHKLPKHAALKPQKQSWNRASKPSCPERMFFRRTLFGLVRHRIVSSAFRWCVHMSNPLLFDELELNDSWESPGRTITETDIVQFACLTGDFDPLHIDHEHCKQTPYGRPIAHGLLGLSYLAGLSSQHPRMKTTAFIRLEQWQFLKPIHIGDTLHVRTEVVGLKEHGRRHGEVTWKRQLLNQRGEVTQEGVFVTLVARAAVSVKYPGRKAA